MTIPQWVTGIPPLGAAVIGLLGVGVGLVGAYVNERAKESKARKYRWDQALFELSKELVAKSRAVLHHSRRYNKSGEDPAAGQRIDELQADVRALVEQIRILGSDACCKAAWQLRREIYAVYATMVKDEFDARLDPKNPTRTPEIRFQYALSAFLIAVRKQLKVKKPKDVSVDLGALDDPWHKDLAKASQEGQ